MSRLDFAPKLKEIQLTDIKKGLGEFTPKPDKAVSFEALKETLKKAGYTLDTADITIVGTLERDGQGWALIVDPTGQRFSLEGENLADARPGERVEVSGGWKTVGTKTSAREAVSVGSLKKVESVPKPTATAPEDEGRSRGVAFSHARFDAERPPFFSSRSVGTTKPLAPIRTTTPGLTVYKGGAVTPRLYFIRQHLGGLDVNRQLLDLSVSYTPSQRLQLEVEVPVSRTSYDDGMNSGAGAGLGNVTLWGKYRFFRRVKTYGDRQAAFRFGLELPTGKKTAPDAGEVNAPAFVRQQLTPISGGLSPHFDAAFSQAGGRFIFGGNVEGIVRSERGGFRLGNEVRVNTDFEYVLLPRDYQAPGKELFLILESTFVQRGRGRLGGAAVEGSKATEFYLAPGLQYAADPRFVVEGSVQVPVVRNTGPLALRTDLNVLLGVKYLF